MGMITDLVGQIRQTTNDKAEVLFSLESLANTKVDSLLASKKKKYGIVIIEDQCNVVYTSGTEKQASSQTETTLACYCFSFTDKPENEEERIALRDEMYDNLVTPLLASSRSGTVTFPPAIFDENEVGIMAHVTLGTVLCDNNLFV